MITVDAHICETCGAAARVRVLRRYDGARPDVRAYCLDCADRMDAGAQVARRGRAFSMASSLGVVVGAGLTFALVSRLWDSAAITRLSESAALGTVGLWLGCLLIFLGAWFRFDRAAFVLSAFAALAVLVDAVGTSGVNDARGWKHDLGLAFGFLLTVGAFATYRRLSRRLEWSSASR